MGVHGGGDWVRERRGSSHRANPSGRSSRSLLYFPGSAGQSLLDFGAVVVLRTAPKITREEPASRCSLTEGLLLSHNPEILSFPLFLAERFTGREGRRKGWLNVYRSHITQEAAHIFINWLTISRDLLRAGMEYAQSLSSEMSLEMKMAEEFLERPLLGGDSQRENLHSPKTLSASGAFKGDM